VDSIGSLTEFPVNGLSDPVTLWSLTTPSHNLTLWQVERYPSSANLQMVIPFPTLRQIAVTVVLLLGMRATMWAHHAFAAEFSATNPIQLTGTITKVAWLNPHARFFMTVKDARGAAVSWELVLGSPNVLIRQGWSRTTLRQGDSVTVNGYVAKGGSRLAAARTVRFSDGRSLLIGSIGDGGPEK